MPDLNVVSFILNQEHEKWNSWNKIDIFQGIYPWLPLDTHPATLVYCIMYICIIKYIYITVMNFEYMKMAAMVIEWLIILESWLRQQ